VIGPCVYYKADSIKPTELLAENARLRGALETLKHELANAPGLPIHVNSVLQAQINRTLSSNPAPMPGILRLAKAAKEASVDENGYSRVHNIECCCPVCKIWRLCGALTPTERALLEAVPEEVE